jgi:hypothetical protein
VTTPYIVSRRYDWALFLGPPLASLGAGALFAATSFGADVMWLDGRRQTHLDIGMGVLINAHLVAVFFRSHANPSIFKRHPARFVAVPIALVLAMLVSELAAVVVTVLATFWDVYHSALQTFGFARIYERNCGNDPTVMRKLDWALNQLLYVGPIVAGASMLAHFDKLSLLDPIDEVFFGAVPAFMDTHQSYVAWVVLVAGALFVAYYVYASLRLRRAGHRISAQKIWLLASTGLCSIVAWGFNPWGQAFVIMNLFHAVQYLGLVWFTEGRRVLKGARWFGLPLFVVIVVAYGASAEFVPESRRLPWAVVQVVAIMHFWYDGFIWSVTRKQI